MLHCDLDEELYQDKIYELKVINKLINFFLLFFCFIILYSIIQFIFYL